MAVLAAVRKRKTSRIVKARRGAVHDFGDERERLRRPRRELFEQEKGGEVPQIPLVGERQDRSQSLLIRRWRCCRRGR